MNPVLTHVEIGRRITLSACLLIDRATTLAVHEKSLSRLLTLQSTVALTLCLAERRCSRIVYDTVCVDNAYGWQYAVDEGWIRHVPAQLLWCWEEVRSDKLSSPTHTCKLPLLSCCVFGPRLQDSQSRVL